MLLVETYLDRSSLSGIGVFTPHDIAAGTRVWRLQPSVDLRFSPEGWLDWLEELTPPVRADMRRHSYKEGGVVVLCLDNARFMNHGGDESNVDNEPEGNVMTARRDIPAGAELLCDYRQYSDHDDRHLGLIGLATAPPSATGTRDAVR
jgi:hypothetical protein